MEEGDLEKRLLLESIEEIPIPCLVDYEKAGISLDSPVVPNLCSIGGGDVFQHKCISNFSDVSYESADIIVGEFLLEMDDSSDSEGDEPAILSSELPADFAAENAEIAGASPERPISEIDEDDLFDMAELSSEENLFQGIDVLATPASSSKPYVKMSMDGTEFVPLPNSMHAGEYNPRPGKRNVVVDLTASESEFELSDDEHEEFEEYESSDDEQEESKESKESPRSKKKRKIAFGENVAVRLVQAILGVEGHKFECGEQVLEEVRGEVVASAVKKATLVPLPHEKYVYTMTLGQMGKEGKFARVHPDLGNKEMWLSTSNLRTSIKNHGERMGIKSGNGGKNGKRPYFYV